MSIHGLLNQTITITASTGSDAYGRSTFDTGSSIKSRFQRVTKQRLMANGDVILLEAIVYVMPNVSVSVNDKVTYQSTDYRVFSKNESVDGGGAVRLIKLELTKWELA